MQPDGQLSRRKFVGWAAAHAGAACLIGRRAVAAEPPQVKIAAPAHGAVLNRRHGTQTGDSLTIRVTVEAPEDTPVTVNGAVGRREAGRWVADVALRECESDIIATVQGNGAPKEDRIRVVWDRFSRPRYRFSIDDNSFFLRDIAQKNYRSLFDCFYLKMLRDLHERYGTKFSVNIYYTTGDDFKLPQFPDRYKGEWRDNSNWLKLAFHAYANLPDRPYEDASPEKLIADLDLVADEIRRFAGEETYAPPTVIHWGMTRPTAFKPLASRGVRALSGYFAKWGDRWDVNYRWDDARSEYLSRHDAWKDFDSGIVFSRVDIVCNTVPLDRIVGTLAPLAENPDTAEIMDLFTHEQYFWPFYANYLPDHPQRLDTAIRWVTEHGYAPVFLHEGFLGAPSA